MWGGMGRTTVRRVCRDGSSEGAGGERMQTHGRQSEKHPPPQGVSENNGRLRMKYWQRYIDSAHAAYRQEGVRVRAPLDLHVAASLGRPVLGTVHLRVDGQMVRWQTRTGVKNRGLRDTNFSLLF